MITFPEIAIDEKYLFDIASKYFFNCAENLLEDNPEEFDSTFEEHELSELKTDMFKVHYTKYFNNEFLGFDESTEFHLEVHIHVYVLEQDKDTYQLAVYRLILNSKLEVVDDFLT